jgi:predicted dehydrogenase
LEYGSLLNSAFEMDCPRLALIGCGNIARKHLEVFSTFPDVKMVAVCNRGRPEVYEIAKTYEIPVIYQDYIQMLDKEKPDAVLIAVGIECTVEVVSECLKRGTSSLIEKPPGVTCAETHSLLELARSGNAMNMVALNRRFYSTMQMAREYILKRGPLISIVVEAPEKFEVAKKIHPPAVQKQWLFANGIHCIDLLRFFGGEVQEVCASATRWVEDQNDSFQALIQFQNKATGHYISNWSSPGRWSVTLYGKGCRIALAPLEQGILTEIDGKEQAIELSDIDRKFKPGLYGQDRHFIDCVKSGNKPSFPASDLEDSVKTMRLVEQIFKGATR